MSLAEAARSECPLAAPDRRGLPGSPGVQTASQFPARLQSWDSRGSPARSAGLSLQMANAGASAMGTNAPAGEGQCRSRSAMPRAAGQAEPFAGLGVT